VCVQKQQEIMGFGKLDPVCAQFLALPFLVDVDVVMLGMIVVVVVFVVAVV